MDKQNSVLQSNVLISTLLLQPQKFYHTPTNFQNIDKSLTKLDFETFFDKFVAYYPIKFFIESILSLVLIFALLPLFIIIPILIILIDHRYPVRYIWRIGQNTYHFKMYKFTSTKFNKEKGTEEVTKLGKILRKTSLDELPQLFNVLRGEMSLIGPRPFWKSLEKDYPKIMKIRTLVKPGISGPWQTKRRLINDENINMLDLDIDYLNNFGLKQDVQIFFDTIKSVLKFRGV